MKKLFLIAALVGTVMCAAPGVAQETAPKKRTKAVRTLEDITIEGEIAVPQVLFITSRDYHRYRDGLGAQFRMSALDVARSADRPTHLRVVAQPEQPKENDK